MTVHEVSGIVKEHLDTINIGCFQGFDRPLLLISNHYPGVWLEHVYDSVFYALQDRTKLYLAENTVNLFISYQKEDGQLPCFILDKRNANFNSYRCPEGVGYAQTQEVVSFAKLCMLVYRMNGDKQFLQKIYEASKRWADWLKAKRMTRGEGLVEMFVGFDTGHDNSGRLDGLSCIGNYQIDGVMQNAAILPPGDPVAPVIAVDMNCNFFATLIALSEMAKELGREAEAADWRRQAAEVKKKLFDLCFNEEDCYFYDVDKNGNQRKYLSCTIFHLFMEGVLDPQEDAELISVLYRRHISNPEEFAAPYPYPSMAMNDPSFETHKGPNSWGYMSFGLTALRATLWMDQYGYKKEFDHLCRIWVDVLTKYFDERKMGQGIDPITGVPTKLSEWYSSTMLFYLYAVNRLGLNSAGAAKEKGC